MTVHLHGSLVLVRHSGVRRNDGSAKSEPNERNERNEHSNPKQP